MTEQLRTLKDITKHRSFGKYNSPDWCLDGAELKAEAVKWIKANRINEWYKIEPFEGWVSYFFNLTSEDLK